MTKRITCILLLLCCCLAAMPYTLVIDAGHGGKDPGTMTKTAKEKNIALGVALAFGRYVEQNCPDVRVIYTRKTDVFIPLHERADIANRNKADVFVSIHVNSVASKKPISGMETYTMGMRRSDEKLGAAQRENEVIMIEQDYKQHYSGYDPRSPESMLIFDVINEKNMAASVELAQLIQKHTCRTANRPNKGVKQDAFLVLRETSMPACLIELGYITTPAEERFMTNKSNVDLMGRGIYQAFVEYKKLRTGKSANLSVAVDSKLSSSAVTAETKKSTRSSLVDSEAKSSESVPRLAESNERSAKQEQTIDSSRKAPAMVAPLLTPVAGLDTVTTIFKVQIFTSDRKLPASDKRLKGLREVDAYKEKGLWKYTLGASSNYNEIMRLRKSILSRFPQAFVIAFRAGERVDAAEAYQNYKKNNRK